MAFGEGGSGGSFGGPAPTREQYQQQTQQSSSGGGGGVGGFLGLDFGSIWDRLKAGAISPQSQYQAQLAGDNPISQFQSAFDILTGYNAPQFTQIQNAIAQQQSMIGQMQGAFGDKAAAARAGNQAALGQLTNNQALNAQMMGFLNQLRGLAEQGYTNDIAGINLNEKVAHEDLNSDATARGAMFAPGTGRRRSNIDVGADIGREGARISIEQQRVNFNRQQAELETQAKNYGLEKDALAASLQATLSSLNLDQIVSVGNILDSINSKNAAQAALAASIIEQAVALAPYFPISGGTGSGTNRNQGPGYEL